MKKYENKPCCDDCPDGHVRIFTPYITKNGKRIYRKNGRFFTFCVKDRS